MAWGQRNISIKMGGRNDHPPLIKKVILIRRHTIHLDLLTRRAPATRGAVRSAYKIKPVAGIAAPGILQGELICSIYIEIHFAMVSGLRLAFEGMIPVVIGGDDLVDIMAAAL